MCVFVCRWRDKTEVEFQNWADGSARGEPRKNRLCVTMSSSTGKRAHAETRTDAYTVYLHMLECVEVVTFVCREVVEE